MAETKYFTSKDIEQIKTMAGLGMPRDQMAAVLDVSKATFERRMNDQPAVREAVLKGRAQASAQIRKTAFQMANSGKHPVMTIFWLKVREHWTEQHFLDEDRDDDIGAPGYDEKDL